MSNSNSPVTPVIPVTSVTSVTPVSRKCAKCGNLYPPTTEYFYADKTKADGLNSYCKTCSRAASAESHLRVLRRQAEYREYVKVHGPVSTPLDPDIPEGYKACNTCGIIKPATLQWFHKHKGTKDGYHNTCKQCRNAMLRNARAIAYQTPQSFLDTLADCKEAHDGTCEPSPIKPQPITKGKLSPTDKKLSSVIPQI